MLQGVFVQCCGRGNLRFLFCSTSFPTGGGGKSRCSLEGGISLQQGAGNHGGLESSLHQTGRGSPPPPFSAATYRCTNAPLERRNLRENALAIPLGLGDQAYLFMDVNFSLFRRHHYILHIYNIIPGNCITYKCSLYVLQHSARVWGILKQPEPFSTPEAFSAFLNSLLENQKAQTKRFPVSFVLVPLRDYKRDIRDFGFSILCPLIVQCQILSRFNIRKYKLFPLTFFFFL